MIDPGHGGKTPVLSGNTKPAKRCGAADCPPPEVAYRSRAGMRAYMTRNEDVFIPLSVRVAKARKMRADLFVSIHADAFTNRSARGSSVFALSTRGATSNTAKYLAQTQNDADKIGASAKRRQIPRPDHV